MPWRRLYPTGSRGGPAGFATTTGEKSGLEMKSVDELERDLDYRFQEPELLLRALTHTSYAYEQGMGAQDSNERLEFLGDAILGFLISDFLCRAQPNLNEGHLSKLKGFLVSAANLVGYAEQVRLGEYLRLGKGEEKTGGRRKQALLVDAFEAVIAAVYLDGGIEGTREVVLAFFRRQIAEITESAEPVSDFKSTLQETLQAGGQDVARYRLADETGPDHQKLFTVEVVIGGEVAARGRGLTKKAAEQAAAMSALEHLSTA